MQASDGQGRGRARWLKHWSWTKAWRRRWIASNRIYFESMPTEFALFLAMIGPGAN
jgi:hypothetical protein